MDEDTLEDGIRVSTRELRLIIDWGINSSGGEHEDMELLWYLIHVFGERNALRCGL